MPFDPKDPNDVDDFVWDWSARLGTGETISSILFVVPSGITKDSEANTTTTATARLSSGKVGGKYRITSRITTNLGRILDHSEEIRVQSR